jgi:hypothetical protein
MSRGTIREALPTIAQQKQKGRWVGKSRVLAVASARPLEAPIQALWRPPRVSSALAQPKLQVVLLRRISEYPNTSFLPPPKRGKQQLRQCRLQIAGPGACACSGMSYRSCVADTSSRLLPSLRPSINSGDMPTSGQKEERMWNLADEMARSGNYIGWLEIEWELRSLGYGRARQLLDDERIRERLDRICAESRKAKPRA